RGGLGLLRPGLPLEEQCVRIAGPLEARQGRVRLTLGQELPGLRQRVGRLLAAAPRPGARPGPWALASRQEQQERSEPPPAHRGVPAPAGASFSRSTARLDRSATFGFGSLSSGFRWGIASGWPSWARRSQRFARISASWSLRYGYSSGATWGPSSSR